MREITLTNDRHKTRATIRTISPGSIRRAFKKLCPHPDHCDCPYMTGRQPWIALTHPQREAVKEWIQIVLNCIKTKEEDAMYWPTISEVIKNCPK